MNEVIKNSSEALIDSNEMNSAISQADGFIRKQYLLDLKDAKVVPLDTKLSNIQIGKNTRMFKVTSLSFSEKDNIYDKITHMCSAVTEFDLSQIVILDSDGNKIDLYLGIASNDTDNLSMQFETFKSSFFGNFPGGKISVLNAGKNKELLESFFEDDIRVSSVSALTTTEEKNGELYGIEHMINAMHGKPYTILIISDAIARSKVTALRQNLEALYTELTPFRDYSLSVNTNLSESYTQTFNLTKSESVTEGKSITENTSFSKSKNKSTTNALNQEENQKRMARNQLLGTALSLFAPVAPSGTILQNLFYGGAISNILGSAQTLMGSVNLNDTETNGEGESYSLSFSEAETTSQQKGFSSTKGISDGSTTANGKTISLKYENKSIIELLSILDKQIGRLQHIEEVGGFECAAYFVTGDNSTALSIANMYRSLLGKGNSLGQNNAINVW